MGSGRLRSKGRLALAALVLVTAGLVLPFALVPSLRAAARVRWTARGLRSTDSKVRHQAREALLDLGAAAADWGPEIVAGELVDHARPPGFVVLGVRSMKEHSRGAFWFSYRLDPTDVLGRPLPPETVTDEIVQRDSPAPAGTWVCRLPNRFQHLSGARRVAYVIPDARGRFVVAASYPVEPAFESALLELLRERLARKP